MASQAEGWAGAKHAASPEQPDAEQLGSLIAAHVNLEALLELAATASPPAAPLEAPPLQLSHPRVRIAVARDAAFNFYYNA